MRPNITIIGVLSSGKSTVGVLLARKPGLFSVNMDVMIQEKESRLLKEIIAEEGMNGFLKVEERINTGLDTRLSVIAPGGGVIYDEEAMKHLKEVSEVVYLKMSYEETKNHIDNVIDRGMVLKPGFALKSLYSEGVLYYKKHAGTTIDEEGKVPGETVDELGLMIESMMDRNMVQRIVEKQKRKLEEKDRKLQKHEVEVASLKEQLA